MKRKEITEEMVRKFGAAFREYNRNSPPLPINYRGGRPAPTMSQQETIDTHYHNALRHAFITVAED